MKVLVLSGRFGMGHEMAANAICEQFRKLDKDTEIVKKDLLEELYPHISKLIFGVISCLLIIIGRFVIGIENILAILIPFLLAQLAENAYSSYRARKAWK